MPRNVYLIRPYDWAQTTQVLNNTRRCLASIFYRSLNIPETLLLLQCVLRSVSTYEAVPVMMQVSVSVRR